jgi:hypothetical protein
VVALVRQDADAHVKAHADEGDHHDQRTFVMRRVRSSR